MTDEEIKNIILQGENERVEFKSSFNNEALESFIKKTDESGRFKTSRKKEFDLAKHRNKLLAEAFYLTGEIEKYGTGYIRIRQELQNYPELKIRVKDLSDFFKAELVQKKDVGKDVGKELAGKLLQVFEILSQNPEITIPEISEKIKLNQRSVQRYLSSLKKGKYIERIGGRKSGYWKILK